jgi:uncharacterized protein YeaO (DUF488 family)
MIRLKRAYDPVARTDGARFLVDQLWPRGVQRSALKIKDWCREVAPSKELRQWFGHDPAKWNEFQSRYSCELDAKAEAWKPLLDAAQEGEITLLFGARDTEHNNAVVLKDYLERQLKKKRVPATRKRADGTG